MAIQFKKATREAVRLKIGIDGPSGSGKTEGMLALLTGVTGGGRIAVADTENESASYYADRYDFDTLSVPNADAGVVMDVIREAVRAGYDGLGVDSLSHAWLAILVAKDAYDAANPKANRWTSWGRDEFGPKWEKLMKMILDAPIHIVATMRSKQAYEQVERDGKKSVVKLGLQPQVREGAEYEFGLVFSLNEAHRAEATKDRTHLFKAGDLVDLTSPELHKRLVGWMNTETRATHEAVAKLVGLMKHSAVSEAARATIQKGIESGEPGAAKVAKWTEQLERRIAEATGGSASADTSGGGQQTTTRQSSAKSHPLGTTHAEPAAV